MHYIQAAESWHLKIQGNWSVGSASGFDPEAKGHCFKRQNPGMKRRGLHTQCV